MANLPESARRSRHCTGLFECIPAGDTKLGGQAEQRGANRLLVMDVLVRVEVRRVLVYQHPESAQVEKDFSSDTSEILHWNHFVQTHRGFQPKGLLTKIDVESDAWTRMGPRVLGSTGGSRPAHHQTRTDNDAMLVRGNDLLIHAMVLPEVVGADCQVLHRQGSPGTGDDEADGLPTSAARS